MDATFLKQLESQVTAYLGNDHLKQQGHNAVALPEHYKVVNLEKYMPVRARFRGEMTTRHLNTYAEYIEKYTENDSVCFINADSMSAKTIFNIGDQEEPGHCDHTALLVLRPTVAYSAVMDLHDRHNSQKELSEWLEDWSCFLTAEDENNTPLDLKKAIYAIRRLTIETKTEENHEQGNFRASRSALEDVEAKSKETPLPAWLYFRLRPYDDFDEYIIQLRVSVLTGGNAPRLVVRIVALETLKNDLAEEFQEKVDKQINAFVKTYIGSFKA